MMLDLDELERLETAATAAPWIHTNDAMTGKDPGMVRSSLYAAPLAMVQHGSGNIRADADLIAAARNALPDLIAAARRADELEARLMPSGADGELLPCPFCGPGGGTASSPYLDKEQRGPGYDDCRDDPDAYAHFVRCPSCGAEGGWAKRESGARRMWNTRTTTEPANPIKHDIDEEFPMAEDTAANRQYIFIAQSGAFLRLVDAEATRATTKHPPLNSHHEAYAVILEELDEYKAEVWKQTKDRDKEAMRTELVQLAAMCVRAAVDLGLME